MQTRYGGRVARLLVRPEVVLMAVTMVWGMTFVVVRHAMSLTGPMAFVAMRFGVAALLLVALTGRHMAGLTRVEIKAGVLIGIAIAASYGLQSAGLQTILASTSAFITALAVPLVPLLQWLVLGRRPRAASWAGIVLATVGLIVLTGTAAGSLREGLGRGEVLTIIGAIGVAAQVILIGRYAGAVDARRVTTIQMAVACALATVAMPLAGEPLAIPPLPAIGIAAAMALASAAIQLAMNWAQRTVSPTRATLIYAGEPVWAALFGRLAGERLGLSTVAGGILILAGVLVAEWRPRRR